MARSIQEIYDSIIAEKETFSSLDGLLPLGTDYAALLSDLSSASKVAIWRLWAYVIAWFSWILENLWDQHKAEVEAIAAAAKYGSLPWYVAQSKLWQNGDTLTYVDGFPAYAVVDPSKRLVTQASAVEDVVPAQIFLKVAQGVDPLTPLVSQDLLEFTSYINQIKPAGIKVVVSSLNADTFRVQMTIEYDPILDPSDVSDNVEAAIEAYLKALPFDGRFKRLAFEDALQAVAGVKIIDIASMEGLQGAVVTLIDNEYVAQAGYMVFDNILSNINYVPYS